MAFRKAIGAVKDQTSISLAKVAGTIAPELEVLVVRATSHDSDPPDEKYYREILYLTSSSPSARIYVGACIATVSRRLSRTHDWIVALKSLVLVHRLLADGHPSFEDEIVYAMRSGMRILNMSEFRAEASSNSWDHAGFVRFYSMYLEEKVRSSVFEKKWRGNNDDCNNGRDVDEKVDDWKVYEKDEGFDGNLRGRRCDGSDKNWRSWNDRFDKDWKSGVDKRCDERGHEFGGKDQRGDVEYGMMQRRSWSNGEEDSITKEAKKDNLVLLKEMGTDSVLGKASQMLRILDRILACRPAGMARNNRLVLVAFQQVVKESFGLYVEISEALRVLLDRFPEMDYANCVKAFDIYVSAGKMFDELIGFYVWCKEVGIARPSEYPDVQKITDKLLGTLEGFLEQMGTKAAVSPKIPDRIADQEPEMMIETIKALPPPENHCIPPPTPKPQLAMMISQDLVNLRDDGVTADGEGNKFALALFSEPATANANANNGSPWETFPSEEVTSAWQNPAIGKADWELALVETASNLSKQKSNMGGGLDSLILNGMYDQGSVNQHLTAAQMSSGSASSVALPGKNRTAPLLALPAPDGTMQPAGNQDPFAASLTVPPPSYVQFADLHTKQQLFVHEQQAWQHYGVHGGGVVPGSYGGAVNHQQMIGMMPYGMPQPGGGIYYYPY